MKSIAVVTVLAGCFLALFFYRPQSVPLPKLGLVNNQSLTEISGKEFDIQEKKPKLVYFYYTKCPDICPTTTWDIKEVKQRLKEKGVIEEQYQIVAVTLDPEYDTVQRIRGYKEAFDINDSNWLFLRGDEQATRKFADLFHMAFEKDQNGFVTHSTTMYVVDSHSQIRARHQMATGDKRVEIEEVAEHLTILAD